MKRVGVAPATMCPCVGSQTTSRCLVSLAFFAVCKIGLPVVEALLLKILGLRHFYGLCAARSEVGCPPPNSTLIGMSQMD